MKGWVLPLIWTVIIIIIFAYTINVWLAASNILVTNVAGDQFATILAQAILVILGIALLVGLLIFGRRPDIQYYGEQ